MALPPLIALEEHFVSPELLPQLSGIYSEQLKHLPDLASKLHDVGSLRLADMDKNQVSFQIVSHAPGPGTLPLASCQHANNQLADAIKANPRRFAGFAVLPMASPKEAAAELRRCVVKLGFLGALIDNHSNGTYYDGNDFWLVFEVAAELNVPIYLHPIYPAGSLSVVYQGNYSHEAELGMGSSSFGWHQDCGLHVLKLFAAGLFDEFPRLKIIIGHFGEMLPFMLERIQKLSRRWGRRDKGFQQVWDENIWITTSGVWSIAPMACILRNTKIDRILFSVDYPFEKNENGAIWVEELRQSGLVNDKELDLISHRNAENLFGIRVISS